MLTNIFNTSQEDARKAHALEMAKVPAGRMPIYLAAQSGEGMKQGIRTMFGMPDPEDESKQLLKSILAKHTNLQTRSDYMNAVKDLVDAGFVEYAQEVMAIAQNIPAKSNAWKEYTDMTSNPTPEGFEIWYNKYKVTGDSKPTSYQEYALTTDAPTTAGYAEYMEDKKDGDDETNFILGDFRLAAYEDLKAKNPTMDAKELERQANVEGQKLFDEYETNLEIARSSGNFLDEIHTLQSIINPDTLEGKPLYDKKDPNGRTYTEAEAVEQAKQNVRLGADQVYDQLIDEHNLTQTSAYHTTSTESANTARRNLRDLNEMLQLLEMGAKTGFSQDFKDKWRSAFESFGFTSKDLAVNEVLRTKMKKLALDRLSALKGAASDKDIEFVEAAGAQMNKSELANEVIIKIAKIYAQDEIDLFIAMNKYVSDYKSQNNRRYPSLDAYKIKEQELIDSKPHISERVGVTMKQLLAIEPDWEYTETAQDTLNNSMFLDALQEKYGT